MFQASLLKLAPPTTYVTLCPTHLISPSGMPEENACSDDIDLLGEDEDALVKMDLVKMHLDEDALGEDEDALEALLSLTLSTYHLSLTLSTYHV